MAEQDFDLDKFAADIDKAEKEGDLARLGRLLGESKKRILFLEKENKVLSDMQVSNFKFVKSQREIVDQFKDLADQALEQNRRLVEMLGGEIDG